MPYRTDSYLPFWVFVGLITLVRLLTIPFFDLGVDEAHYVLYGRYLDLSYFDHPPLAGWTHALFAWLFGENLIAARLSAVLLGIVTLWYLYRFLLQVIQSQSAALFGVVAFAATPMFGALFMMLMPETLLLALIFPVLLSVHAIERHNRLRDWVVLGVLLGLAGLAKYTAVLIPLALLLYLLRRRKTALLLTYKFPLAVLIALVMVSPVIVWNMQHDWISFAFQSDHVAGGGGVNLKAFGLSLAAQFGAYSPFLAPVAFYGLYRALRSPGDLLFSAGVVAAVIVLFFGFASLFKSALPHWNALFYLLMLPVGSALLFEQVRVWGRAIRLGVALSLMLTLYLHSELALKYTPFPAYASLHRDIYGFDEIMREANALLKPDQALAVAHWSLASRALYYNQSYHTPLFVLDRRIDQFDLWQPEDPIGRDLLLISTHDFKINIEKKLQCGRVVEMGLYDIRIRGRIVDTAMFILCEDFGGLR
ncbi:MAG: glycosyltransferase family 39 protein [Campylobacterales bacterium]|nr:glycosyltransferase family 39 protein [Campylobacterales bacterium]